MEINLTGTKVGKWSVGEKHLKRVQGKHRIYTRSYYNCVCECGEKVVVSQCHLREGVTNGCRKCQASRYSNSNSCHWKGYGEIPGYHWGKIMRDAAVRSYEFKVTIEEGWELFLAQDRRCALTGLPLMFQQSHKTAKGTASFDRIDSKLGYIPGNVQWLHKDVNLMKLNFTEERFIEICNLVSRNARGQSFKPLAPGTIHRISDLM